MDWLADEVPEEKKQYLSPWKIVIVDDDEEVHKVTQMTLQGFEFEQRQLQFVNLYSGEEAKEYFANNHDIAMVFLDVVMESDNAGLDVIKYVRNELHNHYTRIILRTGQPGTAPEDEVIKKYDIDGYKTKTQITANTLNHTVYLTLRAYRDLVRIQSYQRGLEALIHSIADITQIDNIMELSNAVLEQIKSVLNAENTHFLVKETEAFSLIQTDEHCWNISIGESSASFIEADNNAMEEPISKLAQQCFQQKDHLIQPPYYCHYYRSARGTESTFVVKGFGELTPTSLKLVKLFSINLIVTIEKLLINQ